MQTGDRLSYHPELAKEEITHFHNVLIQAQTSLGTLKPVFLDRLNNPRRGSGSNASSAEQEAQKQRRLDTFKRAEQLVAEAEK